MITARRACATRLARRARPLADRRPAAARTGVQAGPPAPVEPRA